MVIIIVLMCCGILLQETSDGDGSSKGEGSPLTQSPVQATNSQHPSETIQNSVSKHTVLEYLRITQDALTQQLNAYGIVLTLVAGIMSVAILQPPGGFDSDGHMRQDKLVSCYLFFASLSFLLACTGLFAVIVGSASLYRPMFFPLPWSHWSSVLECASAKQPGFDKISTLESIINYNLSRLPRLKTYLGFSLALGMTAYICGAFSILGSGKRNLWMAIGTIFVSSGILVFEGIMTWIGPALPNDTLARLQQIIH